MLTPIPHSFLRLNRRGGRGSRLVDFPLDRLTHKAHLVNMNGSSYRMKETKKIQDAIKTKAA